MKVGKELGEGERRVVGRKLVKAGCVDLGGWSGDRGFSAWGCF